MQNILEHLKSLEKIVSPLTAFFFGTILTCCAYGLLSSSLALRLAENNDNTFAAGIILAMYYTGYIVASVVSYRIINKVGHIRAFSTYISIFSGIVLLHFFSDNLYFWGVLRFLEGYCIGSAFMCLESWLNARATNTNRGMIMSLYMISSYLGASSGQLLLNIPDSSGVVIYITVSILLSVALVPISLTALPTPAITVHKNMSLIALYKKTPVGVAGCLISGVFVGAFYILGAIYAHQMKLTLEQTSLFMFFGVFGGMAIQLPIGRLSDYFDRRIVMLFIGGFLFLIVPWVHFFITSGTGMLIIGALLMGFGTFILYPISVSHVNDMIADDERVEASGMLILLQSIGMIAGPIVISFFMQEFGPISFVGAYAVAAGVFIVFCLKHIMFKDINYVSPSPTYPIPLDTTRIFHKISEDETLMDKARELISPTEKKL